MVDQVTGIEVRYFAAAADAAGREKETVDLAVGSDLAALRVALIERHGADMERVLSVAAYLVEPGQDGGELTRDLTYPAGARWTCCHPSPGGSAQRHQVSSGVTGTVRLCLVARNTRSTFSATSAVTP